MTKPRPSDDEILDFIMDAMFQENNYAVLDVLTAVDLIEVKYEVHYMDVVRLWNKLEQEVSITPEERKGAGKYKLSARGMWIMRKYGKYSKYINEGKEGLIKKEKVEKNDRVVKNIGILATLGVSLLTLVLTQCPTSKEPQLKKTEEGIQSVEKKLDSLLHVLPQPKIKSEKQSIKDTATSK